MKKILKIEIAGLTDERIEQLIDQITELLEPYKEKGEYMSTKVIDIPE